MINMKTNSKIMAEHAKTMTTMETNRTNISMIKMTIIMAAIMKKTRIMGISIKVLLRGSSFREIMTLVFSKSQLRSNSRAAVGLHNLRSSTRRRKENNKLLWLLQLGLRMLRNHPMIMQRRIHRMYQHLSLHKLFSSKMTKVLNNNMKKLKNKLQHHKFINQLPLSNQHHKRRQTQALPQVKKKRN